MTPNITKRKREILNYLQSYQEENGYFPTLEEIAQEFGLKSNATIHQHLKELEDLGMLNRGHNKARDIEIMQPAYAKPNTGNISADLAESYVDGSMLQLPVAGLITAGFPIEAVEDTTETMAVPRHMVKNENAYVLKVKGDSMIESLIDDGDFVVVHKQDFANDGDIVVALLEDGTATLKEFHKEKNFIRLQPRNKQYKPIRVKNVVIQGKVLGIIRKFAS